jgi:hypothetical protein
VQSPRCRGSFRRKVNDPTSANSHISKLVAPSREPLCLWRERLLKLVCMRGCWLWCCQLRGLPQRRANLNLAEILCSALPFSLSRDVRSRPVYQAPKAAQVYTIPVFNKRALGRSRGHASATCKKPYTNGRSSQELERFAHRQTIFGARHRRWRAPQLNLRTRISPEPTVNRRTSTRSPASSRSSPTHQQEHSIATSWPDAT